jgi:hypothetical protein
MQWWPHRIKKSDHHSTREKGEDEEEQKKWEKIRSRDKKVKKAIFFAFGRTWRRPHDLPKKIYELPFGPQTRPYSVCP